MPAERGPSGTGHDTAGRRDSDLLAAPISIRDGEPIFPAPVAVPVGERDRQQIARLTEAAKAADMAMRWHYEDVIPTAEVPDEATAFEVAIALVRAVLAGEEDARP